MNAALLFKRCVVQRLGVVAYQTAWDLQNRLADEIAAGARLPTLLLLQHPHTFTFGRRGDPRHLLWSAAELNQRGVGVYWVDRGGDVTYHGPGQLVGYPLIPLGLPVVPAETPEGAARLPQADYTGYLRRLETVVARALAETCGLTTRTVAGKTGVWTDSAAPLKLASIGVKVDGRGITRHGFALNVNPDMEYWNGIVACGLADDRMTSLAEAVNPLPEMKRVEDALIRAFGQVFGVEMDE